MPEGLVFDCSAATPASADFWNLVTAAGRLDVAFTPFGVEILVSALRDIIRSKQAADRPQDRQDVLVLREILRRNGEE